MNLRLAPDKKSKIIQNQYENSGIKILICFRVKLIKRSGKLDIIDGNKGEWVYVDPGFSDKTCGWVFSYYLAGKDDFRRLESLPDNYTLKYADGDVPYTYEFFKDGTSLRKPYARGDKELKGKLYIDNHDKIILLKYDTNDNASFWGMTDDFFIKNNIICEVGGEPPLFETCAKLKKDKKGLRNKINKEIKSINKKYLAV